jgi:3-methyladenine DNA glycosylase/8-oxoguanine DNA glycosylase
MPSVTRLDLRGPGGEPVDLRRTLASHGVAELPPMRRDADAGGATVTLPTFDGPRTVRITAGGSAVAVQALIEIVDGGPPPTQEAAAAVTATMRRMLCLDDDLSGFYGACADDPQLAWACHGAGRLLRSPTVFEDVVKTVCTTNCTWSATERMVGALVGRLGEPAPGAPPDAAHGRAFPTPEALAAAGPAFYRDVARAGYRGAYLQGIAARVVAGDVDLEELLTASRDELPDEEIERRLLRLPGVGPYAAAHVMLLLGRHSRLVLDSWTRPKYAHLQGKPVGRLVADRTIARRFRRYGDHAGLAFWLVLTRDWLDDADA